MTQASLEQRELPLIQSGRWLAPLKIQNTQAPVPERNVQNINTQSSLK